MKKGHTRQPIVRYLSLTDLERTTCVVSCLSALCSVDSHRKSTKYSASSSRV